MTAQLEAAAVLRALMDPSLFDRWARPVRASVACRVVLTIMAEDRPRSFETLELLVSIAGPFVAYDGFGVPFDEHDDVADEVRSLGARVLALDADALRALGDEGAVMRALGSRPRVPVEELAARKPRPTAAERALRRLGMDGGDPQDPDTTGGPQEEPAA